MKSKPSTLTFFNFKSIATVIFLMALQFGFAQSFPYGFNYQAVARDANGNAKTNQSTSLRFTIRKSANNGSIVWQEVQTTITNSLGQFNVVVGNGIKITGSAPTFSNVVWGADIHFLEVEIQTGITTFVSIGNQQLQSVPYALATIDPTPAGVINAFGGVTAPTGYILCQGQAVSRVGIYANLFAAIGIAYGSGDGSTTFNVPDMRGMFLRGVDGSSNNDPDKLTRTASGIGGNTGNAVGSAQSYTVQSHNHTTNYDGIPLIKYNNGGVADWASGSSILSQGSPFSVSNTGGTETRPKNIYVNYIIKY